ncbi:MAG: asparagine synthase-related protein [Limisphaerales bacterium]
MPGIAGIISQKPAAECSARLRRMLEAMCHETFYLSGTHCVPEMGIYAGSIAFENLPDSIVFNDTQDIALIFSGEFFLDSEIANGSERGQLARVMQSRELADEPSALLPFFEKLNGLFSGLLIDKRRRKAFLFNDRYGVQRIYFHESNGDFYFASEAKALLRILPKLREFDADGVAEFLTFGCTLNWKTLFRGIEMLPGGSLWTFENGNCRKEKYFSPETWESQPQLSADKFENKFRETFKRILPRYFESNSKIGIALTGGLDTRMIMACRPQNNGHTTCYTFSGNNHRTLDDKIAARVAATCHLEHRLLRLEPDFFSDFRAHADKTVFVTDGCFGISGAHEIYFNRQARELASIRLTGNYGSEIFRGVSTFKPVPLAPQLFNPDLSEKANFEARKFSAQKSHPATFAAFKEIPWNLFGNLAAGRSQVNFRTPFLDNELVALAYQAPETIRKSPLPASRFVKANDKVLSDIPTDRGFAGDNSGLRFLCRRIFSEATFKLDYYNSEGLPRALSSFDPAFKFVASKLKLAGLHKFLHYGSWFRNELSDYLQSAFAALSIRQNQFWNPAFLKSMADEHISGRKNYTPEINAVLTLEAVDRLLFRELPRGL